MKRNTFISATLIMLLGVSSSAQAIVPANSRITSTSTLTVEGLEPLTATVTVTVGLQRSKPLIVLKAGTETQPNPSLNKWIAGKRGGENTTTELTYKYTITTEANGPADYTVEADLTRENLDNAKLRYSQNVQSPIRLGATAVLSVEGNSITVPSDGNFKSDQTKSVNGITAGDKVVICGHVNRMCEVFNVDGVDDSNGKTATITLKETPPGDLSPGDPIAEQATFTVTLDEVVLADDAPQGRATNNLTVTARQADFDEIATSKPQEFVVIKPRAPKMQLYVRNVSDPNGAGDSAYITPPAGIGGGDQAFYGTDGKVKVSPGDKLEYIIVLTAGNTADLDNVVVTSTMPLFTTYVGNSTYLNGEPRPEPINRQGFSKDPRYVDGDDDDEPCDLDTGQVDNCTDADYENFAFGVDVAEVEPASWPRGVSGDRLLDAPELRAGLVPGIIVRNGKAEVTFRVVVRDGEFGQVFSDFEDEDGDGRYQLLPAPRSCDEELEDCSHLW